MVRLNEVRPASWRSSCRRATDAELYFIGRIHTPWTDRLTCPRQGRPDGPTCRIELFAPWDKGLDSIAEFERLEVLYWLHELRRDLVLQAPKSDGNAPRRLLAAHAGAAQSDRHVDRQLVKVEGPVLLVRGLDCLDGTPLIDLKPDRTLFKPLAPAQAGDFQVGEAVKAHAPLGAGAAGRGACWRGRPWAQGRTVVDSANRKVSLPDRIVSACSSPARRPRCWSMCWRPTRWSGWIRAADAGREGVPGRSGARPAGARPADRPRRHRQPRAPARGQAGPGARFRLGDATPMSRWPTGSRRRPAFPMS